MVFTVDELVTVFVWPGTRLRPITERVTPPEKRRTYVRWSVEEEVLLLWLVLELAGASLDAGAAGFSVLAGEEEVSLVLAATVLRLQKKHGMEMSLG
jgi:hypothetical protein